MSEPRLPFLVAIETDPLRYHGENGHAPEPLSAAATEQLIARIAADLAELFPTVRRESFCITGVLYDQAQLLRPGWPIFDAMAEVARARRGREAHAPSMLSIGASDGDLPHGDLAPDRDVPPGILQLLPCMVLGDGNALAGLEDDMEHRFLEEGQLSPKTSQALEQAFQIGVAHARFMTLTDLQAMLKLQLEHFGFGGLWTLLDAALEADPTPQTVSGAVGQHFHWDGGQVVAEFETFDHWAKHGAGKDVEAERLVPAYADWTREYRQYLVTLAAHGVTVEQRQAADNQVLDGSFLDEPAGAAPEGPCSITEQGADELGLVAVTLAFEGQLHHFYPLVPEGLNAIHDHIRSLGARDLALAFPAALSHDPVQRRLVPESV